MIDANSFIDSYISWLKQNTTALSLEDGVIEISSPFLDRHNDYIQIYIVKKADNYLITDDGYTVSELELSGLSFNTQKRKDELDTILTSFGVSLDDNNALYSKCTTSNFPAKKHNLMQAMLAINDLFVLSQPNIVSHFLQDVEAYLRENSIRFTKNIKFAGKSGFDHAYDFVISQSAAKPDRLVRTINNLDRSSTSNLIFSWNDTLQTRSPDTQFYIFVNDVEKNAPVNCIDALGEYGIIPVLWSEKELALEALVA